MDDFSTRLRAAVERAGLSAREVSRRSGVSVTRVTALMLGGPAAGAPGLGTVADLAGALGCEASWLAYGTGPGPSDGAAA